MARQVDAVVETLREQGDAEEVQAWLEEMRDGFAESAEAAVEAIDAVESTEKAARRNAENAARAMAATQDAFARYLGAPVLA
jgi:methyl-accepting chemotaxis protein